MYLCTFTLKTVYTVHLFTVHGTPMYGTLYNVIHRIVYSVHGTIYHLFFSPLNFAQEIKMISF